VHLIEDEKFFTATGKEEEHAEALEGSELPLTWSDLNMSMLERDALFSGDHFIGKFRGIIAVIRAGDPEEHLLAQWLLLSFGQRGGGP